MMKPARAFLFTMLLLVCSCRPKDQAGDALDQARQLVREGKYEEASQKYIWFHHHALSVDRSYYGVRLSYALAEWVELGKKYPKALDELKKIRDQKTSRLMAGETDRQLFHELESINKYLTESKATVELFKKFDETKPQFASSVYDLAEEALVQAEEYSLARKYLGNPSERFNATKRKFEQGMRFARTSRNLELSRKAFEGIFAEEVARLITVLNRTGDRTLAQEMQTDALKVVDTPAIRDALKH